VTAAQLKAAATGAATPEQARNPYDALKRQLEQSKHEFLPLLGNSSANVDRFIRVVLNAVLATPDLLNANRRTLIAACMRAAQDGLLPDGREAVLNIYNTKVSQRGEPDRWEKAAQYLPMVGGLIKKLYESGEVTYIDAACVYEKDRFTFRRGEDPKLEHEPTMEEDPGQIIAAYVVAKLKSGEIKREVMPRRDIERVKGASKSAGNGPWVTWYDQQAIKSVIKRLYKQMPKADAFEAVAESDNLASGYAAMGSTVGAEIQPAPPAAPAGPALTHAPADPLDFDLPGQGVEEAQREETAAAPRARKVQAKPAPVAFDEKACADKLRACSSVEVLNLMADELRDIPDDEMRVRLFAVYEERRAALEAR